MSYSLNEADHPLELNHGQSTSSPLKAPRPYYGQSRPSLNRITDELQRTVEAAAAIERASPSDLDTSNVDLKGKGRATDTIEVLIHAVKSTDSIMSVALLYGIEVAALRKANKLWASDTIHLRTELYIPLEACLRGNVRRGPEEDQAIILPRGHYRSADIVATPPLICMDSDHLTTKPIPLGLQVPITRISPLTLQAKKRLPRASADYLRNVDRPTIHRSTSMNYLDETPLPEPRISTSSSRPSLDFGWGSRPASRTSIDAESEASIELQPRNSSRQQRPPRNLWFSVADDGIDPRQGMY